MLLLLKSDTKDNVQYPAMQSYSNSGGSVADGKSTVQIFDAFKERNFSDQSTSMMAAYENF